MTDTDERPAFGSPRWEDQYALSAAVDALETLGALAVAVRHDDGGWAISVHDADGARVLQLDYPDWTDFRPSSAGHRLIEHGWTTYGCAHRVRERGAGWAHRTGETATEFAAGRTEVWTAPVHRDPAD